MGKNKGSNITGGQKFWCFVFGISYIIPTYIICWLCEEDGNEKREALCHSMLWGAKTGIALIFISIIYSFFRYFVFA